MENVAKCLHKPFKWRVPDPITKASKEQTWPPIRTQWSQLETTVPRQKYGHHTALTSAEHLTKPTGTTHVQSVNSISSISPAKIYLHFKLTRIGMNQIGPPILIPFMKAGCAVSQWPIEKRSTVHGTARLGRKTQSYLCLPHWCRGHKIKWLKLKTNTVLLKLVWWSRGASCNHSVITITSSSPPLGLDSKAGWMAPF